MAEFIEKRLLDACPAYTFSGGPRGSTRVNTLANGNEYRNRNWTRFKHAYGAPFLNISQEVFEVIKAAFMIAGAQATAFRFKDWTDYRAERAIIGPVPGGSTPVQLVKRYTSQGLSYDRAITKPVAGTVTVYVDATTVAGTLDSTTGFFTPSAPWPGGSAVEWSGEFDVPVRFNTDELPFTLDNPDALNGDVSLIEVFE